MARGRKRDRSASSEDKDKSQVLVDRISFLPTEILGFILSFLTFKEATATCILSRRWKYLWTLISKLDLDGKALVGKIKRSKSGLETQRSNYVEWVDGIISWHRNSHLSSNLEEFRVFFDLNVDHTECIDKWLDYALSRKVQRLEMNLIDVIGLRTNRDIDRCYNFPYKKGNFPDNFKLLKNLSLNLVNVSGEAVEFFLKNCPLLERLSLSLSQVLLSLEIVRPSPLFKCLEISCCHNLKSVVVRDSNVFTIKYRGFRIYFQLVNVPLLTQLWIGGAVTRHMNDVAEMFSSVLPQLEMFNIRLMYLKEKETRRFASAVEMCNLKQLVVSLWSSYSYEDSILPIIYLISTAPRLQRFVLEAPKGNNKYQDLHKGFRPGRELRELIPRAYLHHLKEVEIVGYGDMRCQLELIKHFVEKDCALENIIIDPRCFKFHLDQPWVWISRHNKIEDEISARAHAQNQLKKYFPSRINVVIL